MASILFDLNAGFSVVDVETTGTASRNGYIIEIGIVNVHNRQITDTYHSLIRPPVRLQPYITSLTGITNEDLEPAPPFSEIAYEVESHLKGNFFVAHNVSFDYGFLKTEFERLGKPFYMNRFCTVKVGRKLFPGHKHYNLDAMIERMNVVCADRHRALGDATATAQIFLKYMEHPDAEKVFAKFSAAMEKRERWRERLEPNILQLPTSCGVYFFKDANDLPLYIGKSNNILSRVLSHLREDDIPKKKRLLRYTDRIDYELCGSELESLIAESRLIKKHQPFYNVQQLVRKGYVFVRITDDEYPKLYIVDSQKEKSGEYIGPFRSAKFLEFLLDKVQRHLKLCPELMKPRHNQKGYCFSYQLNGCSGACGGAIAEQTYREHIEEAKEILKYYTQIESKDNIEVFLKSKASKEPELKEFRDAMRRERKKIKSEPASYEDRFLIVDTEEQVSYLIYRGLLEQVFRGDEAPDIDSISTTVHTRTRDDGETLDEQETIQRYIRSNRKKLKIVSLSAKEEKIHGAYLSR